MIKFSLPAKPTAFPLAFMLIVTLVAAFGCTPKETNDTENRNNAGIPQALISDAAPIILPDDLPPEEGEIPTIDPANWPVIESAVKKDPAIEARVKALVAQMTLEEKVGQMIQAEISTITPEQVKKYHIGSVLNGGGMFPNGNRYAKAEEWVELADAFYLASVDKDGGRTGIPIIWGSDAVHGHNNVYEATILPHNIGLGAANNPALVRELGRITALEVLATGLDWTFAPTLAVVRDDRWGRTYESYSEDPEIVAAYAKEVVEGIQGVYGTDTFMNETRLLANAKHYVGDGGTYEGEDQGDNRSTEEELRDIHAAGYFTALEAGAQIVMASFNSWHGEKLHGHKLLLTDVLKDRMGFDGFVVSDWNGHGQIEGCTVRSCAQAVNAGIDMVMVTRRWQPFYENMLAQVKTGDIPMARIDDAVTRILRVKARAGVLDSVKPSARKFSGDQSILGSAEHRALARQAVRESLVLLKNNDRSLPINASKNIVVLGDGAHNIAKQSGGWTLTWQGTGTENSDFPNGESIYDGLKKIVEEAGGRIELIEGYDVEIDESTDVAIMVFGEDPYAEFQGDRRDLKYISESEEELATLLKLKEKGIKTVSVFLSGRPLWVNPYINASDAFVAAWLPGSEGGGIADVLLTDAQGNTRYDFTGKLSFSWPKTAVQFHLNVDEENYDPLFPYAYGLSYEDEQHIPQLAETSGLNQSINENQHIYFEDGRASTPWNFFIRGEQGGLVRVSGNETRTPNDAVIARLSDHRRQGDTMHFIWNGTGEGEVALSSSLSQNLTSETKAGKALAIELRARDFEGGKVAISINCEQDCNKTVPLGDLMKTVANKDWKILKLPLSCFQKAGADMRDVKSFLLETSEPLSLEISDMRLVDDESSALACPNS